MLDHRDHAVALIGCLRAELGDPAFRRIGPGVFGRPKPVLPVVRGDPLGVFLGPVSLGELKVGETSVA